MGGGGLGEGSTGGCDPRLGTLDPVPASLSVPTDETEVTGVEMRGALASGALMAQWGWQVEGEGADEPKGREPSGL